MNRLELIVIFTLLDNLKLSIRQPERLVREESDSLLYRGIGQPCGGSFRDTCHRKSHRRRNRDWRSRRSSGRFEKVVLHRFSDRFLCMNKPDRRSPVLAMGDRKPRWSRSDAERFKLWLFESVERVDALTRAASIRMTDDDRDEVASLLSTCDPQQFRYLCGKLEEIMERLQLWHDQIGDVRDRQSSHH